MTTSAPLLELVGVAGVGKTTLLKTLKQRDPSLCTDVVVSKPRRVDLLMRHTARFLPAFLWHAPCGRWLSWHELRLMAYLEDWQRAASGERTSAVVFDHGPIFQLVQLREFGPPLVASPAFGAWWNAARRAWARALDLVVWLDAPDTVLLSRIAGRDQRHIVKHMPAAMAVEVLTRYRRGYEKLMGEMVAEGHLRLIRLDTSRMTPEAIAEEVLLALRSGPAAGSPPERARAGSD